MRVAAVKFIVVAVLTCLSVSGCQTTQPAASPQFIENPDFEQLVETYKIARKQFDSEQHDEGIITCSYVIDHIERFTFSNSYKNYRKHYFRYYCLEPIAYIYLSRDEWSKAHDYLERAQDSAFEMAHYYPGSVEIQSRIARNYFKIAGTFSNQRIVDGLVEAMAKAREVHHWLLNTEPNNPDWHVKVIILDWFAETYGKFTSTPDITIDERLSIFRAATERCKTRLKNIISKFPDVPALKEAMPSILEMIDNFQHRFDKNDFDDFPVFSERSPNTAPKSAWASVIGFTAFAGMTNL